jgi:dihydroorotate dehydrogenase
MKTSVIGGLEMQLPIILGAGVCKDPRHLVPYLRRDVSLGAVIAGSFTQGERTQNDGVVQWPADWTEFRNRGIGLNSFGMPNPGIEESLERFDSVPFDRPSIASIAGFSADEYATCAWLANRRDSVAAIEVNWGCGNTGKIPDAYSYVDAHATLDALERLCRQGELVKPVWIKLSPYITAEERDRLAAAHPGIDFSAAPVVNPGFAEAMIQLISRYPFVRAIVYSNTLANCRVMGPDQTPVTTPFDGRAGLSGPILKSISIGLIRDALACLPTSANIDFIGCGGVLTGDDAADYFDAGAIAVQCTSGPAWYRPGPRFFMNLVLESDRLQQYLV